VNINEPPVNIHEPLPGSPLGPAMKKNAEYFYVMT